MSPIASTELKGKRKGVYESEGIKKCKESHEELDYKLTVATIEKGNERNGKKNDSTSKEWPSWAQSLYRIAMNPEMHMNEVMEISDEIVVTIDLYPKAKKHLLVLPRCEGLDRLADVSKEHLPLLRRMHDVGLKWAEKCFSEDKTLAFRLGYHLDPSMRQLHLHLISQDFDSKQLKKIKHWNLFNTSLFCDSVDIMEEIENYGHVTLEDDERLLSAELRCHRCQSVHPNIPRLKSHIADCRTPFPASLLQKII